MQIDQNEDGVSDEALEAAGTGAWTFVCTGGFQCNSFSGCFRENPGSATRQSRDFSGPVLGASGPRPRQAGLDQTPVSCRATMSSL